MLSRLTSSLGLDSFVNKVASKIHSGIDSGLESTRSAIHGIQRSAKRAINSVLAASLALGTSSVPVGVHSAAEFQLGPQSTYSPTRHTLVTSGAAPKVTQVASGSTPKIVPVSVPVTQSHRLDNVVLDLPPLQKRTVTPMGWAPGKKYPGLFGVQMTPTTDDIIAHDPHSVFHQFGKVGLMDETPIFNDSLDALESFGQRSMFHQEAGGLVDRYYDPLERPLADAYRSMMPELPPVHRVPVAGPAEVSVAAVSPRQESTLQKPQRKVDDLFGDFFVKTNAQGRVIG